MPAKQICLPGLFVDAWSSYVYGLRRLSGFTVASEKSMECSTRLPQGCCLSVVGIDLASWVYVNKVEGTVRASFPGEMVETGVFAGPEKPLLWSSGLRLWISSLGLVRPSASRSQHDASYKAHDTSTLQHRHN